MRIYKGLDEWEIENHPGFCLGYRVHSAAFICPYCLTQWARLQVDDEKYFQLREISCLACYLPGTYSAQVPGSLLENPWIRPGGWDKELLEVLPPDLLRREFDLHLKALAS